MRITDRYALVVLDNLFSHHRQGRVAGLIDLETQFRTDLALARSQGYGFIDKTIVAENRIVDFSNEAIFTNQKYIHDHVRNLMLSTFIDLQLRNEFKLNADKTYSQLTMIFQPDAQDINLDITIRVILNQDDLRQGVMPVKLHYHAGDEGRIRKAISHKWLTHID